MLRLPRVKENLLPWEGQGQRKGSSRSLGREGREFPGEGAGPQACSEVLSGLYFRDPILDPLADSSLCSGRTGRTPRENAVCRVYCFPHGLLGHQGAVIPWGRKKSSHL